MRELCDDVRFALRVLLRQKLLTLVAAVTLALGMGANTAIFSTVSGILWNTLPYPEAERLVAIWGENPRQGFTQIGLSYKEAEMFAKARSLRQVAAFRYTQAGLHAAGAPQSVLSVETGNGFFETLRETPAMGRPFSAEEYQPGDHRVAILTAGLWQREFGGDPGILNREVIIDGRAHTVVGIMPPDFSFLYSKAEIFLPLRLSVEARARRTNRSLRCLARLAAGTTVAEAGAEIKALAQALEVSEPAGELGWSAKVRDLELEVIDRGARTSIQTMFWAVMGVLLIACTNIACLLLARGTLRQRELAIRASLGAVPGRLARLLLTESLVLSLMGGVLGAAFAWWAIPVLRSLAPKDFPRLEFVQLDVSALGYTFLLCLACGLIAGGAPAWMLTRGELARTLHEGGRGGTFSRQRILHGLVTAEVALAMILLTVTGLLVRNISSELLGDPGFDKSNLLTATVTLTESGYPEPRQRAAFFASVQEKLRSDGRVQAASAVQTIPLGGNSSWTPIVIEGRTPAAGERNLTGLLNVLPAYFATMRIPLLAGRDFTVMDNWDAERVAIVNQTMARRYWPQDSQPLGRRFRLAGSREDRFLTVVGLARDVRHNGASRPARPEIYLPVAQTGNLRLSLLARTPGEPGRVAAALREAVWAVDRNQPVGQLETMEELIDRRTAGPRVTVQILGFLSVLALLLAAIGIYGVLSYLTSQRAREIGIRVAMGAEQGDIISLVLRRVVALAFIGIGLGTAAAAALTPLIQNILEGVTPHDPATFSLSALALALTALGACAFPLLRALRLDPVRVLREE